MNRAKRQQVQEIRVGEATFCLVPKSEYARRVREAESSHAEATGFARTSIGRDLRTKREKQGLTQACVASRAGLRLETISRLENGRGNPTVATVRRILRALGEVV